MRLLFEYLSYRWHKLVYEFTSFMLSIYTGQNAEETQPASWVSLSLVVLIWDNCNIYSGHNRAYRYRIKPIKKPHKTLLQQCKNNTFTSSTTPTICESIQKSMCFILSPPFQKYSKSKSDWNNWISFGFQKKFLKKGNCRTQPPHNPRGPCAHNPPSQPFPG